MKNTESRKAIGRLIEKGRRSHPEADKILTDIKNGVLCTKEWINDAFDGWYIDGKPQRYYITEVMKYALQHNILIVLPSEYHDLEWNDDYLDHSECYNLPDYDFNYHVVIDKQDKFFFLYQCMRNARTPSSIHLNVYRDSKKFFIHSLLLSIQTRFERGLRTINDMDVKRVFVDYPWNLEKDCLLLQHIFSKIVEWSHSETFRNIAETLKEDVTTSIMENLTPEECFIMENTSIEEFLFYLKQSTSSDIQEEHLHI